MVPVVFNLQKDVNMHCDGIAFVHIHNSSISL